MVKADVRAMKVLTNTGQLPVCPTCLSPCVPKHGRSGPKLGTYVVVECVTCKEQFKIGTRGR